MSAAIPWALTVIGGLFTTGWGLVVAQQEKRPRWLRWWAAVLAPLGILAALAGATALAVPGFFSMP